VKGRNHVLEPHRRIRNKNSEDHNAIRRNAIQDDLPLWGGGWGAAVFCRFGRKKGNARESSRWDVQRPGTSTRKWGVSTGNLDKGGVPAALDFISVGRRVRPS